MSFSATRHTASDCCSFDFSLYSLSLSLFLSLSCIPTFKLLQNPKIRNGYRSIAAPTPILVFPIQFSWLGLIFILLVPSGAMKKNPNPAAEVNIALDCAYPPGNHRKDPTVGHQVLASMPLPGQIDGGDVGAGSDGHRILHYARDQDESDGGGAMHRMNVEKDGMMESEGLEPDGPSDPNDPAHPGDTQGMIVPHGGSNQLTLSFQGEVYVFDSVSPEKVQAVLLLLGGREISSSLAAFPSTSNLSSKQRSSLPHRVASLMRFREKRKERNFDKKIRYTVRKEVALRMQRSRGQFISSKSKQEDTATDVTVWDASPHWGSLDKQPPSAAECHHCAISAKSTPLMRRGPDGPRTLCNACGLVWANKGTMRDLSKTPPTPIQSRILEAKDVTDSVRGASAAAAMQQQPPLELTANGHESS